MRNELFGVFGDRADLDRVTTTERFARVVETPRATVGVRDLGYGLPNRTAVYETDDGDGAAVVWGEVVSETGRSTAERLYHRVGAVGRDAFAELNGSYLAFVDRPDDSDPVVVTDPIRSWECFYTDAPGVRVFGSDAARVAKAVSNPAVDGRTVAEVTHFGVAFGDDTAFSELGRVPFDGYLTPESTGELRRFVYDPQPPEAFETGDYAAELAARLERAIERRTGMPGRTGLMLSGGYDSRLLLSESPDVDVGYTMGDPGAGEVAVASRLADQYGVDHETLEVTPRYLDLRPEVIQYTGGVRESLHIHHRGNNVDIDADSMLHGALFDTLFRGFFLPERGVELFGRTFPLSGLDPDPDVPAYFAEKLGCLGGRDPSAVEDCEYLSADSARAFAREVIEPAFEAGYDRCENRHNAVDLLGIKLKPTLAFRTHLADHYVESLVAADSELLEWHLKTPPEHRTDETWLDAIGKLDSELLRHSPPDRPHRSFRLNEIERVVRGALPLVSEFDRPWPDRRELYEQNDLDRKLFPGYDEVHGLPARVKLRMNDLTTWIEFATGEPRCTPDQLLRPPEGEQAVAPRTDGGWSARNGDVDGGVDDANDGPDRRRPDPADGAGSSPRGPVTPSGPTGPTGPSGPSGPSR
ncbi:asparagine synthase-related protein [Halobium salinum]|uniref:Asparagine synthase-related protein n=1 Tax=Halobium salinum TaxID=1364940 RepID=A0ABD5PAM8_9EURY|nr:asparagine synthase-related protein [Halobium salinum]